MEAPQKYLGVHSEDRDLIDLITGMLKFKKEDRYGIDQVLAHPWLSKLPISTPEDA